MGCVETHSRFATDTVCGAGDDALDARGTRVRSTFPAEMNCIYCQKPTVLIASGIAECRACESLVSTEPAPGYPGNYHAYRFSYFRPKFWYLAIKAMRSGLRRGLTVCDIGCGAGHSLVVAKWFGCVTWGFDIPNAQHWVKGCDRFVPITDAIHTKCSIQCDLTWCWHTLEHTSKPVELLRLCLNTLRLDGELWLEFPEASAVRARHNGDLKTQCMFPEHRGLPSTTWALRSLLNLGASIVSVYPPCNPSWLYGKRDENNDVVIRVRKR